MKKLIDFNFAKKMKNENFGVLSLFSYLADKFIKMSAM